jgi:hypothetical protein
MRHAQKRAINDTWRHIGRLVETSRPVRVGGDFDHDYLVKVLQAVRKA